MPVTGARSDAYLARLLPPGAEQRSAPVPGVWIRSPATWPLPPGAAFRTAVSSPATSPSTSSVAIAGAGQRRHQNAKG